MPFLNASTPAKRLANVNHAHNLHFDQYTITTQSAHEIIPTTSKTPHVKNTFIPHPQSMIHFPTQLTPTSPFHFQKTDNNHITIFQFTHVPHQPPITFPIYQPIKKSTVPQFTYPSLHKSAHAIIPTTSKTPHVKNTFIPHPQSMIHFPTQLTPTSPFHFQKTDNNHITNFQFPHVPRQPPITFPIYQPITKSTVPQFTYPSLHNSLSPPRQTHNKIHTPQISKI